MKNKTAFLSVMCLLIALTSGMDCINSFYGITPATNNFVATFSGAAERPNPVTTSATGNGRRPSRAT